MARSQAKYRLTRGYYRRFESGRLVSYVAGDVLALDEREARRLQFRVEPVESASEVGGDVEFTAPEVDALGVAELKTVIAAIDEPSVLHDVAARERSGKNRVTVFRAVEERVAELEQLEDE